VDWINLAVGRDKGTRNEPSSSIKFGKFIDLLKNC
jgi:hypothetical protein